MVFIESKWLVLLLSHSSHHPHFKSQYFTLHKVCTNWEQIHMRNNVYTLYCVCNTVFRVLSSPNGAHQPHHLITHIKSSITTIGCGVFLNWQWTMGDCKRNVVQLVVMFWIGWERNWSIMLGETPVMKPKQEGRNGRLHPVSQGSHGGIVTDISRLRNRGEGPRRGRERLPKDIAIISRYCISGWHFVHTSLPLVYMFCTY